MNAVRKSQWERAYDVAAAATDEPINDAVCDALEAIVGPTWMQRVAQWIEDRELERLVAREGGEE